MRSKEQTARKRLENFSNKALTAGKGLSEFREPRSKPLERCFETREFESKEQTARKRLENFRTRSKPLETETREFESKEQTARKRLRELGEQGANCTREFENKQAARKETREFENKEQTARKELEQGERERTNSKETREILKARSKPLERD